MEIKTGHLYHIKHDEILWFIPLSSKVEKYIDHVHTYNGVPVKVGTQLKKEILNNFKNLLKLHKRGHKVFFVDINKIKGKMIEELNLIDK